MGSLIKGWHQLKIGFDPAKHRFYNKANMWISLNIFNINVILIQTFFFTWKNVDLILGNLKKRYP